MTITQELGDQQFEIKILGRLGDASAALGDKRKPVELFERKLNIGRELGDQSLEFQALHSLGQAFAELGEARVAAKYYEEALAMARQFANLHDASNSQPPGASVGTASTKPEAATLYPSCFISYAEADVAFARRLHAALLKAGLRVWFAPEDMKAGRYIDEQIETAINTNEKLLLVLSDASLESEWVMDELRRAFRAERKAGKRKLFPVRIIGYEALKPWQCREFPGGPNLADEVRRLFIPDFSFWQDEQSFQKGLERLLQDMKGDAR